MSVLSQYPNLPHDDRCELIDNPTRDHCNCAVREVTWVYTEARELVDTLGDPDWQAREAAFMARKTKLLAYIEATE